MFSINWVDHSAYSILLGTTLGTLIGFGFRKAMKYAERKRLIDRQSYVAQYVSLAIFTIGQSPTVEVPHVQV